MTLFHAIDKLLTDQERRHAWLFRAAEQIRAEDLRNQSTRGAALPNKRAASNHGDG